jgi:hypothetical protein
MTRKSRTLALSKKWYVSFDPVGRKQKRATRMFETEDQAKAFALNILTTGLAVSAGTVNPYLPKRTISPADAKMWARSE